MPSVGMRDAQSVAALKLSVLSTLRCPGADEEGTTSCLGQLGVSGRSLACVFASPGELLHGSLECRRCAMEYPVLWGVAILVPEPKCYLRSHIREILADATIKGFAPSQEVAEFAARLDTERVGLRYEFESKSSSTDYGGYLLTHYSDVARLVAQVNGSSRGVAKIVEAISGESVFDILTMLLTERVRTPPEHIVDLGCGVGGLARRLARVGAQVLGLDVDFRAVATARCINFSVPREVDHFAIRIDGCLTETIPIVLSDVAGSVEFVVADAASPPIAAQSVDAVACCNLLDVVSSPRTVILRSAAMLAPGGALAVASPWYWESGASTEDKWHNSQQGSLAEYCRLVADEGGLVVSEKIRGALWPLWINATHLRMFFDDVVLAVRSSE